MLARCISVLAVAAFVLWAQSSGSGSAEQEIRRMETARLAYPLDSTRWADDIADDALFMQGTGVVQSKQQTIDAYKSNIPVTNSTEMTDTAFRQSGDTAIFSYVTARVRHDDGDRAVRHQHVMRTVVYQHRGDRWRLVLLSAALRPYEDAVQRPVAPNILDEYAGVYADFPPPRTVTLSREGTRLMAQGSAETEKTELIALSDDTFAIRGEANQLYFERGPGGHVLHLWYRDTGGDEIEQKRIK